ncbi:condensation domain-containing protein [Candidatus Nitrotoga arctica]|uniref:Condensation domain-containing protein n=1 Tax=Candidatus Nitrotoga arctica TaxID=453162 RepID=A0ABM8Z123_9PROT|nr:protein of unknown function [Candidatus Nitrotoga arctica]
MKALTDRSSLPLSFAQQRLWFLDQFEHGSANYNIPCAYRIRGSLNIGALRHALNEVVRRHESLRTTFAMQGDVPVQVIVPDLKLAIPLLEANDESMLQPDHGCSQPNLRPATRATSQRPDHPSSP